MVASYLASIVLLAAFGSGDTQPKTFGKNPTMRALTNGTVAQMKGALAHPRIKASVTQMQYLELSREDRRSRNRFLVRCLGNRKIKAFINLKKNFNQEIAVKIIEDFSYSPSCVNNLKDALEDLRGEIKDKYDATSCTCTSVFDCCGHSRIEHTTFCCNIGAKPTTDSFLTRTFRLLKATASSVDFIKDLILTVSLIILTGKQIKCYSEDTCCAL